MARKLRRFLTKDAAPAKRPGRASQTDSKQSATVDPPDQAPKAAAAKPAGDERAPQPTVPVTAGSGWSELVLVRPWLLVGGLWLTSIAMIAIAISGLTSPGKPTDPKPVTSALTSKNLVLSGPDVAAASRLNASADSPQDPAVTPSSVSQDDMPTWPLLAMVVACAGGCVMMTKQSQSETGRRRTRRSEVATVSAKAGMAPPAKARSLSRQQRRAERKRRLAAHQPSSQVMVVKSGQPIERTNRPAPRQKPLAPVSFNVESTVSSSSAEVSKVSATVIPAHESSPLDWSEGSLAHKLDLRRSRSLNSLM